MKFVKRELERLAQVLEPRAGAWRHQHEADDLHIWAVNVAEDGELLTGVIIGCEKCGAVFHLPERLEVEIL